MPVNVAGPSNDIESGDIAAGAVTIPKLSFDPGTQAELEAAIAAYIAAVEAHRADSTVVHGIADTAAVVLTNDARLTDQRVPTDGSVTPTKLSFDPATQAELDAEAAARAAADALLIPLAQKGAASGVATLGADSKLPPGQMADRHLGTTLGFYNAAAVAQAAFIAAPTAPSVVYLQAEAAAMKTAVDAIRTVLINLGLTAAP